MKMNRILICFLLLFVFLSCKKDDDKIDIASIPQKSLSEVAVENDAEIKAYLETHFYNYEEFENPTAGFNFKIKFDTIAGDNASKIPLINQVETQLITEVSSTFLRTDDEEVQHTLYYLSARDGVGESPTIGDNTVVRYEGSLLDGTLFDASSVPTSQYLPGFVKGYANGIANFNGGVGPVENGDGTVSFDDYGVGVIFMPSALGYFDSPRSGSGIPAYAPLIFQVDVLAFEKDTDFDGDGIPSILEDLDGDGDLNNDNTDSETESFNVFLANHYDTDDDDDGIDTIDEIELDAEGNFVSFKDTDGDGIYDHLDNDN
jgi:FKBP-type peptidyl-prolyl cis-trans isomerase FkpA